METTTCAITQSLILQCWSSQLWLRHSVTDRPFQRQENFQNHFTLSWQNLTVLLIHFWILCNLSVVEALSVPCPKASFAKKKTSSKWSVFSAQHSLRKRLVLPGAIMSHVNRTLSYLNAIFYSSLKWLKITYLCRIQSLCI